MVFCRFTLEVQCISYVFYSKDVDFAFLKKVLKSASYRIFVLFNSNILKEKILFFLLYHILEKVFKLI